MRDRARMAVHASAILIPALSYATSTSIALTALIVVSALYSLSEALRLSGRRLPFITEFTLRMSRDEERPHFVTPPIYLAAGAILSLAFFPEDIAYAAIAIVAVGDPVASYVGGRLGRTHIGQKTLEGFIAGLIVSFAAALLWVHPSLALVGSATGMLLELLGLLNDNITTPIGAGLAMIIMNIL